MLVSTIMSRQLVTVSPDDTVETAARLMERHNIGAVPVCSCDGRLRGMLTDRDLAVRALADEAPKGTKVKNVMSKGIVSVDAHGDVKEALELMAQHKIRRLPVTSLGSVIGMISLGDISKSSNLNIEAGKALKNISEKE